MTTVRAWEAWLHAAAADVVSDLPQRMSASDARALGLAAWSFHQARSGSVFRAELARDFFDAWMTFRKRMAVLAPLLHAWRAAGLGVCAFKGLAVAATAYPHPAMRHYTDIDLVIDQADAFAARQCVDGGWDVVTQRLNSDIAFYLVHRETGTLVEVHNCLVPMQRMGRHRSASFTRAMLVDAVEVDVSWEPEVSTPLRVLAPVDLMLAMIVNRSWSSDAWRHKPHDYLDMVHLSRQAGVDLGQLRARARDLGAGRTVEQFLLTCDPWRGRFDLASARRSRWQRWKRDLALLPTSVPPRAVHLYERACHAPGVLWRMAQALPIVWAVSRELSRGVPPAQASQTRIDAGRKAWVPWHVDQAVSWARWLLRPALPDHLAGPCVLHSLSVFRLVRSMGMPAVWQLGHARLADGSLSAHAWVRLPDRYAFGVDQERETRGFVPVQWPERPSQDPLPPPSCDALQRQP